MMASRHMVARQRYQPYSSWNSRRSPPRSYETPLTNPTRPSQALRESVYFDFLPVVKENGVATLQVAYTRCEGAPTGNSTYLTKERMWALIAPFGRALNELKASFSYGSPPFEAATATDTFIRLVKTIYENEQQPDGFLEGVQVKVHSNSSTFGARIQNTREAARLTKTWRMSKPFFGMSVRLAEVRGTAMGMGSGIDVRQCFDSTGVIVGESRTNFLDLLDSKLTLYETRTIDQKAIPDVVREQLTKLPDWHPDEMDTLKHKMDTLNQRLLLFLDAVAEPRPSGTAIEPAKETRDAFENGWQKLSTTLSLTEVMDFKFYTDPKTVLDFAEVVALFDGTPVIPAASATTIKEQPQPHQNPYWSVYRGYSPGQGYYYGF